jgi:hypothetical protein
MTCDVFAGLEAEAEQERSPGSDNLFGIVANIKIKNYICRMKY